MINKQEVGNKQIIIEKLKNFNLKVDFPMKEITSFHIGGPADYFVKPKNTKEIKDIVNFAKNLNIPIFVMGNGTNLLVSDKGIRGIVIQLTDNFNEIKKLDENTITVQSGALMKDFSSFCLENSLTGFEFGCGIPGTIGGAVTMNAGAYDSMMSNVIIEVTALDKDLNIIKLTKQQMQFGYRQSIISKENMIVLCATIRLEKGDYDVIKSKIQDFTFKRTSKQPLSSYSAGSTFKRPEGYFAGKLIQDSGLKGLVMKNVAVSSLHSGFVINTGNATCQEVIEFITFIKQVVGNKFHVSLEEEVKIVGDFSK